MDLKTFKTDLTYSCKKFAKEGVTLSAFGDHLSVDGEGKFVADGTELDALEMFVLVKGYVPTKEMLTIYHDKWQDKDKQWHESHIPHHQIYNLSMVDVISEQAMIARSDIYSFLDGLDNVEPEVKSEFHTTGVYIREKFLPVGVREKTLTKAEYQSSGVAELVKKFTIQSRRGATSIMEVEVELLSGMELLPAGEYRARIHKPTLFHQKVEKKSVDGTKKVTMVPDVWHSLAFYDSLEEAKVALERTIRGGFEFEIRKNRRTEYTEEEVQAALAATQIVML